MAAEGGSERPGREPASPGAAQEQGPGGQGPSSETLPRCSPRRGAAVQKGLAVRFWTDGTTAAQEVSRRRPGV